MPHQKALGAKLTHAKITTDYSENLLEFITGVHSSTEGLVRELNEIHAFTSYGIKDELLWPCSLPAQLPSDEDIPLAYFGESNVGKLKTLYRMGLGHRYGRSMQSIAGVHYNFSMSENFWEHSLKVEGSKLSIQEYKNKKYFDLIRNYRRYSWVLTYLFGSSSVVHDSFLEGKEHDLSKLGKDAYYSEYGTSLRMGGLGYTSSAQQDIGICYNQLSTYISTIEQARQRSIPEYEQIGLEEDGELKQLNTNLLQIDNEFYSTIRPKNIAKSRESALKALDERGIEYIEVRLLDVDSECPTGIGKEQIEFLHVFLMWCLTKPSPAISGSECTEIEYNFDQIVRLGRKDHLTLLEKGKQISRDKLLNKYFSEMKDLATGVESIDQSYLEAVNLQYEKVIDIDKLPSSIIIKKISEQGYLGYYLNLANKHKKTFNINEDLISKFEEYAEESHKVQKEIERTDTLSFKSFLKQYFEDIKI
jgi:glutamate--cysteine ligase